VVRGRYVAAGVSRSVLRVVQVFWEQYAPGGGNGVQKGRELRHFSFKRSRLKGRARFRFLEEIGT